MQTIWKFSTPLKSITDTMIIDMPAGACVLTAGEQGNDLCIWAIVEPEHRMEKRRFYIRGTGHELGEAAGARYIGTAHMVVVGLVLHVFESIAVQGRLT
jgi:hypothetical protein